MINLQVTSRQLAKGKSSHKFIHLQLFMCNHNKIIVLYV